MHINIPRVTQKLHQQKFFDNVKELLDLLTGKKVGAPYDRALTVNDLEKLGVDLDIFLKCNKQNPYASRLNYLAGVLAQDGEIELVDTVWEDLRVPVVSTRLGGTKDPDFAKVLDNGSSSQGVFTYLFDDSTEEELYFMCQIPHNYKHGTDLHAHVHWMPVANGSAGETVSWGLEYSLSELGATFGNTTLIYGDTPYPDETLVADRHYLTELGEIDGSSIDSVSAMLLCRVFRDTAGNGGTDDYGDDAALLEIDFHYEIDTLGSSSEYIK